METYLNGELQNRVRVEKSQTNVGIFKQLFEMPETVSLQEAVPGARQLPLPPIPLNRSSHFRSASSDRPSQSQLVAHQFRNHRLA